MSFTLLFLVAAGAMVAFLVWSSSSSLEHEKEDKRKLAMERCRSTSDRSSVLVLVVTNGSPHSCARTLFEIFEKARCPQRMHVAVFDTVQNGRQQPNIVQMYGTMAREQSTLGKSFAERVQYFRVRAEDSRGLTAGLARCLQSSYRGQTFVCTLNDVVELEDQWEHLAI